MTDRRPETARQIATDYRYTRALSRIEHAIDRLHCARQVLLNAHHIVPNSFHVDAAGGPHLVRPGCKAGWEEHVERVVEVTEAALKVILRDARTTEAQT